MSKEFLVRVEGVEFAAAHMATAGGQAERLHGHSYAVAAEVEGALTDDAWVFDFVQLKAILRDLCKALDHRVLLQRQSRILELQEEETHWKVRTPAGTGYVLPKSDVAALPLDNTTAERLAEWLCDRLWQSLADAHAVNVQSIALEVSEGPRQYATYRRER